MSVIKLNQMCDGDMGNIYIYLTSAFLCTGIFWRKENFVGDVARTLFGTMKHFFIILGLLKGSKMQGVERESFRYCCSAGRRD